MVVSTNAMWHLENNDKVVFQNLVHFHFHFKKYEMLVPQLQSRHQFVYSLFMGCAVFMFRDPFQMSSLQTNNELSMDRSLPFTYMASTFRIWRKWKRPLVAILSKVIRLHVVAGNNTKTIHCKINGCTIQPLVKRHLSLISRVKYLFFMMEKPHCLPDY